MKQKHDSRKTSINSTKLPALYSKGIQYGKYVIDYGCGKYTDHLKKAIPTTSNWFGYDPYNQPELVNIETETHLADTILCSNVLNVIDSDDAIIESIEWMKEHMNDGCIIYCTVYEGNKSGIGAETQNGESWQRNSRIKEYIHFFTERGLTAYTKRGMIIAHL